MGELTKGLERFGDQTSTFTLLDVATVFALSLVLSLTIGWVYRTTHRGVSYSQTYVHTLVMFSLVVAFVMLIIGSNIARAFTLVGALSIVRFRHAVKEPRDIGFVFTAMAVGMACGTRFYGLAVFATLAMVATVLLLFKLNLFAKVLRERILIVRVPVGTDYEKTFATVFHNYLEEFNLISMETVGEAEYQEAVYSVVLKPSQEPNRFLDAIREVNGHMKASLVLGQQEIDL
ncbi:MAG TPA: DUF4956 domain-containing protein [Polyangiaceae bacterium]|nr:DUF4956 domain-containing protein [Polyangiaceae bacterium]